MRIVTCGNGRPGEAASAGGRSGEHGLSITTARITLWLLTGLAVLGPAVGKAQTTVKYVHTDALGSVVAMTDASGAVIETTQEYEPYGQQLVPAVQDGPGYTGHVQDAATGLVYMQQRYYDPAIGRFLSVDPVTALSDPVGMFNRYKYAANNPYRFTDPDGRQERAYGAAVGLMLRDKPEAMRVWEGGEAAATTEGSGAEQGAAMGEAVGEFADAGDFSPEAIAKGGLKLAMAAAMRGKGKGKGGGTEHTKTARPSTNGKHEAGQARKQQDRGGEKGDSSRRAPRKPPPDHKGPWPPKPPPPPDDKKK